jgi:hypothetical protein
VTYGLEVRCSIQLSYGRTVYNWEAQCKSHHAAHSQFIHADAGSVNSVDQTVVSPSLR